MNLAGKLKKASYIYLIRSFRI